MSIKKTMHSKTEKALLASPKASLRSNPIAWWYQIAAPPEPAEDAPFARKDLVRRAQLASFILLFMSTLTLAFIPLALASINPVLTIIILSALAVCSIGFILNKRGHVIVTGVLGVGTMSLAIMLNLITAPHNILTTNGLLTYDLLVLSELIAVSLLPPRYVFFVAFLNSAFICADIVFQPHSLELESLLHASTYTIIIRPLALQIIVAAVTYLWVRKTIRALERADRAEVVAKLERSIAKQKLELDAGIQQIQQTLVMAANGNFAIRTPLAQDNVLWNVSISLNTLIARLQRSNQSDRELQRIRTEILHLVSTIREAEINRTPVYTNITETSLDPLLQELTGRYLVRSSRFST